MSHLDYYKFQAEARGVRSAEDVRRIAEQKAYLYEQIVSAWLPQDKSRPIAEIACGHGSFLHWLRLKGFSELTGVDASAEQVALARQLGVRVDQDDAGGWLARQPRGRFTALVAIDLVEHLAKDDFMNLLRGAYSALAPGGSLILRLPNGDSPFVGRNLFNDITHVWTYTPNCLNSLAQMHGYTRTEFVDEGAAAIRDHRWLKVPLAQLSACVLRSLLWAASREKVEFWSPNLWARLIR